MAERAFLTRKEAAVACGCSANTLRRDQRGGRLPNTRLDPDGAVRYAIADLVAAGRLDPLVAGAPDDGVLGRSRTEQELATMRQELAVAHARLTEQAAWIARSEQEVAFLRALLVKGQVA